MSWLSFDAARDLVVLGGPVVAVLGVMSVFGLAIVLLKLWQFTSARVGDRSFVAPALADWQAGQASAALDRLEARRNPIAGVLYATIHGLRSGVPEATVREEAARMAARELNDLRSYFRPLELIGTLSPLLGLLGTVLGMIEAFRALQAAGTHVNPAVLSGGIWEALLTTAVGLIIAIPAVTALNWLERRLERLHEDMQDALTRVFTRSSDGAVAAPAREEAAGHAH